MTEDVLATKPVAEPLENSVANPDTNPLESLFAQRTVLCDGAMGTVLYAKGVFINRCYDELNLSQPEMIRNIHEEYLQAGAEIIETNTFGANPFRLQRHGLEDKTREINEAGARIARQAVAQLAEKQAGSALVAGSVGPLGIRLEPLGKTSLTEAREAFKAQIEGLVAGGVDLIIIETMQALDEAEQAILAARAVAPHLPVMAMVTVDEDAVLLDGSSPETAALRLTKAGAHAIGANCSLGPATILTAIEAMRSSTHLPLIVMPNAGMPRAIDGRNIYLCSPEYMASFAKRFAKAGVQFIGGCCGTTPNHIRAMKSALRAMDAQRIAPNTKTTAAIVSEVKPAPLRERSRLGKLIADNKFVTMVEIVSPKGIDCSKEIAGARLMLTAGVDVVNIPDSPRASARMSAQSLCIQIQQQTGIETLLHYTCRDRNVLSIQSDLLGASSIVSRIFFVSLAIRRSSATILMRRQCLTSMP